MISPRYAFWNSAIEICSIPYNLIAVRVPDLPCGYVVDSFPGSFDWTTLRLPNHCKIVFRASPFERVLLNVLSTGIREERTPVENDCGEVYIEVREFVLIITLFYYVYLKSFIAKRVISILVNLRYLRFKLLKYKENNKKIFNTFDHNFKNIPLYIMSNVSLERYYFVLYDGALTLKMSKMPLNAFCDKTLHLFLLLFNNDIRKCSSHSGIF